MAYDYNPTRIKFEFTNFAAPDEPQCAILWPSQSRDFSSFRKTLAEIFGPATKDCRMLLDAHMPFEEAVIRLNPSFLADPELGPKLARATDAVKKIFDVTPITGPRCQQ